MMWSQQSLKCLPQLTQDLIGNERCLPLVLAAVTSSVRIQVPSKMEDEWVQEYREEEEENENENENEEEQGGEEKQRGMALETVNKGKIETGRKERHE